MPTPIRTLTPESIAPYGILIATEVDRFAPVQENRGGTGWLVAINRVVDRTATVIHRHHNTNECFTPLTGTAVVLLARPESPTTPQAFLLDRPICVAADVWHTTVCLSESATVQICEATDVVGEACTLPVAVTVGLTTTPEAPTA